MNAAILFEWPLLFPPWHLATAAIEEPRPLGGDDGEPALIARARGGNRQAFDDLFRRHVDRVHRRLTYLVGPDPEREDLIQEVFLAVYRGLQGFRGEAAFSTWLYRIVIRVAQEHLRRRRRRRSFIHDLPPAECLATATTAVDTSAELRLEIGRALTLLDRLKPKKRIAFILREVEGLSLKEIGEIVGADPAAVGQRVRHAHREILLHLEREQRRTRGEA